MENPSVGNIDACSFSNPVDYSLVDASNAKGQLVDLDNDGRSDLIVPFRNQNKISVFRNTSSPGVIATSSFATPIDVNTVNSPVGLAYGDLDGDAKQDVIVINYNPLILSVYKNQSTVGTIAFAAPINYSIGSFGNDVAIHDLDFDGKPEIILTSFPNEIVVLRNLTSTGVLNAASFAAPVSFTIGSNPFIFSVADLDGDLKPDIAVPNANEYSVSLLRNTSSPGTISFASPVSLLTGPGTPPAGLGATFVNSQDFDGDGKQELFVTNHTLKTISVFRNMSSSGAFLFAPRFDLNLTTTPSSPLFTDFNGDGKADFMFGGDVVGIFENKSVAGIINATSFGSLVQIPSATIRNLSVGDLDGDGRADIFTVMNKVSVLQNQIGLILAPTVSSFSPSSGPIGAPVTLSGTNFSTPFANTVKINGINAPITSATSTSLTVTVPVGATTGPFEVTIGCNTVTSGANFLVGTFIPTLTNFTPISGPIGTTVSITGTNFDPTPGNNIVYFGATRATVTAATSTQLTVTVPGGATFQPITVQANGLTAYSSKPFVVTFAGGGSIDMCSFASDVNFATIGLTPGLDATGVVADIDGDGKSDVLVSNRENKFFSIYRNVATTGTISLASFEPKVDFSTGTGGSPGDGPIGIEVGDVDGDGKRDVIVMNHAQGTVAVFRNASTPGTISLQAKVDFPISSASGLRITLFDIDRDGKSDLIVTSTTNIVSILRNTSNVGIIDASSFATRIDFPTGTNPTTHSIGDIDGDGNPDIVVSNLQSNTISILRNTSTPGSISLAPQITLPAGNLPNDVALADFDGDGKTDMVVPSQGTNSIYIFRNTSSAGSFSFSSFQLTTPGFAHTLGAVGDVDGDGKVDLAVTNVFTNMASVLKNTSIPGTISFSPSVEFELAPATSLRAVDIHLTDIDGDGKNDLTSTSYGFSILRNIIGEFSAPTITSFSPTSGLPGTSITINGNNFLTPFSNRVAFNGVPATITASDATTLTVTVPLGVSTGPIEVTIGCNSVTSTTNFVICSLSGPVATGNSGCQGGSVILSASGASAGQYRWYSTSSGGTPNTVQQDDTFSTPSLSSTTSYWVSINDGTCESARTEVVATVLPLPAAPVALQPPPVCAGASVLLTASGGTDGNYRWYDGTQALAGETNHELNIASAAASKTFQVSLHDGVCESTKIAVLVSVKNCTPPVIASTTSTAFVEGFVSLDLCALITDAENDIDVSSLQVLGALKSSAPFILDGCTLTINYQGFHLPEQRR
ncbi:MAG: VCBS repeat-containing protein [Cyclobacteriaceae bacterium]|nr:VCBS repeat-containing protein [Cyclobacteriaceae bacterium]